MAGYRGNRAVDKGKPRSGNLALETVRYQLPNFQSVDRFFIQITTTIKTIQGVVLTGIFQNLFTHLLIFFLIFPQKVVTILFKSVYLLGLERWLSS